MILCMSKSGSNTCLSISSSSKFTYIHLSYALRANSIISQVSPTCLAPRIINIYGAKIMQIKDNTKRKCKNFIKYVLFLCLNNFLMYCLFYCVISNSCRRNVERKDSFAIFVRNGKVTQGNNVHAYQNIIVGHISLHYI